jgi:hypothetical protein
VKKPVPAPTATAVPAVPAGSEPPPRVSRRLDPAVKWALGLYLVSFPLMLVWLVLIAQFVAEVGVDLRENPAIASIANLVYVVLVLSTLVSAGIVGLVGWRRRRRTAALVVAILSGLTAVAFVLFPALAG